jgi:hypothetical protein
MSVKQDLLVVWRICDYPGCGAGDGHMLIGATALVPRWLLPRYVRWQSRQWWHVVRIDDRTLDLCQRCYDKAARA